MKKLRTVLIALPCIILVGLLGLVINYKCNRFVPWVSNTQGTYSMTNFEEKLKNTLPDEIALKFTDKDYNYIQLHDYVVTSVEFEDYSFYEYLMGAAPRYELKYTLNKESLKEALNELFETGSEASIEVGSDNVIEYVNANAPYEFDVESLVSYIESSLLNDTIVSEVNVSDFASDRIVASNETCKNTFDSIKWVNDFHITYSDGYIIDKDILLDGFDEDWNLDINSIDLSDAIKHLDDSYSEKNKVLSFTTSSGNNIDVLYNTFGYRLNKTEEEEFIQESISNKVSVEDRIPELMGVSDFDDTYIEVSISDQHVWHYVNGELCCESDCVTGDTTKGRGTPTGVFYVTEKINGKYLKGANYTTWVNKWMRLTNSGVGLHDAYWRSNFGGNIYKGNGSHGCVNLPKNYAYSLYDEIEVGTPVVIYNE